jgi:hypothetical protein
VERNFTAVDDGMLNQNVHMTHWLAKDYAEGCVHRAPLHHNAFVRWVPQTQELRQGTQTVSVLGKMKSSRATLETMANTSRVVYPGTYPNTDERMSVRFDGGLEHDIILSQQPGNLDGGYNLAYTGRLQLSKDLTLWDGQKQITGAYTTRNDVYFKNYAGVVVFNLRRPVAYDASVTLSDGSLDKQKQATDAHNSAATACAYHIDFDESGPTLAIVTPGEWLSNPMRAYPVTIDPNMGPFGLADGNPPIYTGAVGTDTLIPANAGGVALPITSVCAGKPDNGFGTIPMPFPFDFYGTQYAVGAPLYVHIDGFANFDAPASSCPDSNNMPIPTAGYPISALYAYWSDLKFTNLPGSGIYWFTDGTFPNRRLVIEWFQMGHVRGASNQTISFNLVLYECENKIQVIIGTQGDTDLGLASVGIENAAIGIQYDFNSGIGGGQIPVNNLGNNNLGGGFGNFGNNLNNNFLGGGGGFFGGNGGNNPGGAGNQQQGGNGNQFTPITPGTSVVFSRSAAGFLTVTATPTSGCIPFNVCFTSKITVPQSACSGTVTTNTTNTTAANGGSLAGGTGGPTTTNTTESNVSFAFHWIFGDNSEAFTADVCHTWVTPGSYTVQLITTDQLGTQSTLSFNVKICDVPSVVVTATPQGGLAPLFVTLNAFALSSSANLQTAPTWTVERLSTDGIAGPPRTPLPATTIGTTTGTPVQALFDSPGMYRVTASFAGTDTVTGLATNGVGTVFIFVAPGSDTINDTLLITDSKITIDWVAKQPAANSTAATPIPKNPNTDTMTLRGLINLPGLTTSDLIGRRVMIMLNGVEMIFDSHLDAFGNATFENPETGENGAFNIALPSGVFTFNTKHSLYADLGVSAVNEKRMLPAFISVIIDGIYPVGSQPQGALITYDYKSTAFVPGPPDTGGAAGVFHFGSSNQNPVLHAAPGVNGQVESPSLLISGAFMVTQARIKLLGKSVYATLSGKISRYGGDPLRPANDSNVVVMLGGFQETLNFTSTAGFKTSGKAPALKFTFKRPKNADKTGIATLSWANQIGDFSIKTNAIPNEQVGINPALGKQTLRLGLVISPENSQIFDGESDFEIQKVSPTDYVRLSK